MDAHHSTSMPAPMMCSGSSSWGSVSPKCTIMRMAWMRGVKKSCPWGLNSSLRHLHRNGGGCKMLPVWPTTEHGTALAASAQPQLLADARRCQQNAPELIGEAQTLLEPFLLLAGAGAQQPPNSPELGKEAQASRVCPRDPGIDVLIIP